MMKRLFLKEVFLLAKVCCHLMKSNFSFQSEIKVFFCLDQLVDLFRAVLVLSVCFVGRGGVACVIRVTHLHRVDDRWWIVWIWRTADVLLLVRETWLTSR